MRGEQQETGSTMGGMHGQDTERSDVLRLQCKEVVPPTLILRQVGSEPEVIAANELTCRYLPSKSTLFRKASAQDIAVCFRP